jgi:hypothetical protein
MSESDWSPILPREPRHLDCLFLPESSKSKDGPPRAVPCPTKPRQNAKADGSKLIPLRIDSSKWQTVHSIDLYLDRHPNFSGLDKIQESRGDGGIQNHMPHHERGNVVLDIIRLGFLQSRVYYWPGHANRDRERPNWHGYHIIQSVAIGV